MKDHRDLERARATARCKAAGQALAESVAPGSEPDRRQWTALAVALPARRRARWARRWAVRLALPALAAATWMAVGPRGAPLGYTAHECGPDAAAGTLAVAADVPGTLDFSDGSRVVLAGGARGRIVTRGSGAGARLILDAGAAALDVVHRPETRWLVEAGPFHVDVIGTVFDVSWSPPSRHLRVVMRRGRVEVSGGALAARLPLVVDQILDVTGDEVNVQTPIGGVRPAPGALASAPAARPAPLVETGTRPSRSPRSTAAPSDPPRGAGDSWSAGADAAPERDDPMTKIDSLKTSRTARLAGAAIAVAAVAAGAGASAASHGHRGSPVAIGEDGKLGGPMTGYAWVAAGPGTSVVTPSPCNDHGCFTETHGQLCTRGTIPALVCAGQGTPELSCNWTSDWGTVIGLDVTAGRGPWHAGAPASVSIAYRGARGTYRLNVHRASDPDDRVYCVDAYQSGQIVEPRMLKTACWADAGDTLASFDDVDKVFLAMVPGQSPVPFDTCITGIAVNGSADPAADGGHVTIEDSGKLGGGMNGYAWVAGGAGTSFTAPRSCTPNGCFSDTKGRLCAVGSMAALICSGQGTAALSCDWSSNWGAVIGLSANLGGVPWGADAPAAVALTFSGGRADYQLIAHRAGDPKDLTYCLEGYRSGQTVDAHALRTSCWTTGGVPLASFERVDLIGLQVLPAEHSQTFDACITDVVVR